MYIVHTIHVHTQCVCVYVFSANTCAYTIVYVCVFAINKHTHWCKILNALFAANNGIVGFVANLHPQTLKYINTQQSKQSNMKYFELKLFVTRDFKLTELSFE